MYRHNLLMADVNLATFDLPCSLSIQAERNYSQWNTRPTASTGFITAGHHYTNVTKELAVPVDEVTLGIATTTTGREASTLPQVSAESYSSEDYQWSAKLNVQIPETLMDMLQDYTGHAFTGSITVGISLFDQEATEWVSANEFRIDIDVGDWLRKVAISSVRYLGETRTRAYFRFFLTGLLAEFFPTMKLRFICGPSQAQKLTSLKYHCAADFNISGVFRSLAVTIEAETKQSLRPEFPFPGEPQHGWELV